DVGALIEDVRQGRRAAPRSLLDLETSAPEPPGEGLTPEEAHAACAEALAAYRTLLDVDPARVVSPRLREQIEQTTGPIRRVVIDHRDLDVSWCGRRIWVGATECVFLVGTRAVCGGESRLDFRIEARTDGWRVVQAWVLPPLRMAAEEAAGAEDQ